LNQSDRTVTRRGDDVPRPFGQDRSVVLRPSQAARLGRAVVVFLQILTEDALEVFSIEDDHIAKKLVKQCFRMPIHNPEQ